MVHTHGVEGSTPPLATIFQKAVHYVSCFFCYLSPIIYLSGEKNPISGEESHQSRRIPSVEKNSASAGGDQKQSIPGGSTISKLKKAMNSLNTSYRYIKEFMAYLNLSGII